MIFAEAVLSSSQVVMLYSVTLVCSVLSMLIPFWLITRSEKLIEIFSKGGSIYLRFITIILVIWSATVLSMQGKMDEGPAAIFGTVVGYVFGLVGRQTNGKSNGVEHK